MSNFERYIEEVFSQELDFKIPEHEVQFIKTGVRKIVNQITAGALDNAYVQYDIQLIVSEVCKDHDEVIFEEIHTTETVMAVGSSAEHTRNNFPDEFDFIFVLKTLKVVGSSDSLYYSPQRRIRSFINVCNSVTSFLFKQTNSMYTDEEMEIRFLRSDPNIKALKTLTFELQYSKNGLPVRVVEVDLVPVLKIVDDNVKLHGDLFTFPGFFEMVIESGAYFLTRDGMSFTNTEVAFMRKKLSSNHRKIYRVLKYLINGHSGENELTRILRDRFRPLVNPKKLLISSYKIKSTVMFHHYQCLQSSPSIGQCLTDILRILKNDFQEQKWPHILTCLNREVPSNFIRSLEKSEVFIRSGIKALISMIECIHKLQCDSDITKLEGTACHKIEPWVLSVSRDIVLHDICKHGSSRCCIL